MRLPKPDRLVEEVSEWWRNLGVKQVRWLAEQNIAVWVIDPLSKLYRDDEQDNSALNRWRLRAEDIAGRAGVRVVVLVHHTGHDETTADRAHGVDPDSRGSQLVRQRLAVVRQRGLGRRHRSLTMAIRYAADCTRGHELPTPVSAGAGCRLQRS